jgi:glycosyltransferase involved in cell wall biosynthesis
LKISLITGSVDPHYQLDLLKGLIAQGIKVDFIGSDAMKDSEVIKNGGVQFYNLRGDQSPNAKIQDKIIRILKFYLKLIIYAAKTDSKLFHIQWLNKFIHLDRTVINIYYKILGKKLVFTAHNINAGVRDGNDTFINRLTLKFMYKIVDHIVVHTKKMKIQLIEDFMIRETKVTIIQHGINMVVPNSDLTRKQAKEKLNLKYNEKIVLFFGNITPYKGLEYLILALVHLKERINNFKLIITGRIEMPKAYWEKIERIIERNNLNKYIIKRIEFIPDEEIEIYYKSADVLILPYKHIFQSGPLFLAFNFGLPVIATDVGSLREDIIEGKTGFVCKAEDPDDLAEKINLYFKSDLYKNLEENRGKIIKYANEKYSWEKIGEKTYDVYKGML